MTPNWINKRWQGEFLLDEHVANNVPLVWLDPCTNTCSLVHISPFGNYYDILSAVSCSVEEQCTLNVQYVLNDFVFSDKAFPTSACERNTRQYRTVCCISTNNCPSHTQYSESDAKPSQSHHFIGCLDLLHLCPGDSAKVPNIFHCHIRPTLAGKPSQTATKTLPPHHRHIKNVIHNVVS